GSTMRGKGERDESESPPLPQVAAPSTHANAHAQSLRAPQHQDADHGPHYLCGAAARLGGLSPAVPLDGLQFVQEPGYDLRVSPLPAPDGTLNSRARRQAAASRGIYAARRRAAAACPPARLASGRAPDRSCRRWQPDTT